MTKNSSPGATRAGYDRIAFSGWVAREARPSIPGMTSWTALG